MRLKPVLVALLFAFLAAPARPCAAMTLAEALENVDPAASYLIYLHGGVADEQGVIAESPQHGPYGFDRIVEHFEDRGLTVVAEVRQGTNANRAASDVVMQVRRLMAAGVPPSRITVAGFSEGGFIALLVASSLHNPHVKYVVMAGCGRGRSARPFERFLGSKRGARLKGNLFSIYAASDLDAGSCSRAAQQASGEGFVFREQQIRSLKGHGVFYQPRPEWVNPVAIFAKGSL